MAKDFTLHHTIARPVSVHCHRHIARAIHALVLVLSVAFLFVFLRLFFVAYNDIAASKFASPAQLLLIPLIAGAGLLAMFIARNEQAFVRELAYLKKKYKIKYEHATKHK